MSAKLLPLVGVLFAASGSTSDLRAQEAEPAPEPERHRDGLSIGFNLHRFQDDFGSSLTVGTPTFLNDSLRLTAGGGLSWYPYALGANNAQTWLPYYHGRLVVEGGRRIEGTPLRLYGVGGVIAIFTPSRLSDDLLHVGGYGGFGFELYMPRNHQDGPVSYMIELGGIGTGLSADKLPGKPIIANGFLITVGMRFYP